MELASSSLPPAPGGAASRSRDALAASPWISWLAAASLVAVPPLALPGPSGGVLVWMALAAPAAGALVGGALQRSGSGGRLLGTLGLLGLPLASLMVLPGAQRVLPAAHWAGLALAGVALLGAALGATAGARRWRAGVAGGWLLGVACAAHGAATGWGLLQPEPPFSPEVTAWLLDLSPVGLVLESGGADWMRSPEVYDPAGTSRIGPELRLPWRGAVAAPLVVVVGCGLLALALRARGAAFRGSR